MELVAQLFKPWIVSLDETGRATEKPTRLPQQGFAEQLVCLVVGTGRLK
ncbi:hypothetical protein CEV32_4062 [Brucella rhizosphaerae]|uniref:Uncharacterized protein n=1 Tax=Brucella rhizosphaerae TaxID=571254 RepID=A0A256FQX2_9HYPH|nr:hypothetical protein CEV32_4062 [Brucella rhizosphaerae]